MFNNFIRSRFAFVVMYCIAVPFVCAQVNAAHDFWAGRDVIVDPDPKAAKVRIGIWDSGVNPELFRDRWAINADKELILRGYDAFKNRQDTAMAVLPETILAKRKQLDQDLRAFDDIDSGLDSPAARQMIERLKTMSEAEEREFDLAIGRWSGYAHGTAVADIALSGHGTAEIIVARMEWWHGSPPVPCWSKELADKEAVSIGDLLKFLVDNGARVVNMSWGRYERSYLSNLSACAPDMAESERKALARYTVEKIRGVLIDGMRASPNVLFVAAAGNAAITVEEANPATRFTLPNFILVGAVDEVGKAADFTNTGPEITIYANGRRIPARLPGGETSYPSGTSMSTPIVANAAAKLLSVNPNLSGAEMKRILETTADKNPDGLPLLHTAKAVKAARGKVARSSK